jgi:hypothetical protein
MTFNAIPGSGPLSPLSSTPAVPPPQRAETSATDASSSPARGTDTLSLSGTGPLSGMSLSETVQRAKAAQGVTFDVDETSERLIASHGGNLEQAYFESLDLRNTTKEKGYPEKLAAYSEKLGMDRNFTPDELRDIEHYMFAAASTAEKFAPEKNASQLDRSLSVLGREPYAASLAVLTVGYSAAKVVNQALPDSLKFLKSRTAPSLDEVGAGLKGIWRGIKDGI